jgi:hypothetical protein
MKRKPDISRRQISTTASVSKQVGGKPVVTLFNCPNGHRKLLTRCSWSGGDKPIMQKIVCANRRCGFMSDHWASTEMGAIRSWNNAVAAKECSECEQRGRCPKEWRREEGRSRVKRDIISLSAWRKARRGCSS